jgi:hypothetical protein
MSRSILLTLLGFTLSLSAFAQDLSVDSFNGRFNLVRNDQGQVSLIKLKRATTRFTIMPFIEQLKEDLLGEQASALSMSEQEKIAEINEFLTEMGYDLESKSGQQEAQAFRDSILNVKNIDVEAAFAELDQGDFWQEFQNRLHEALTFLDPTVLNNLNDSRFFYKKAVTHKVVVWALEEARKRFSNVPILNIATFVIVRVHDMMLEQRHFAHNMMLHYFETVPAEKLGMTKKEVDHAVSSIYEYRIEATNLMESNRAHAGWDSYGMNQFYMMVRSGNARAREWAGPLSDYAFKNVKKLNFAFAEVTEGNARKIYHLHHKQHQFSMKPSLAYDYSNPKKVKRLRSLLNIGGVALGFLKIPDGLKNAAHNFMKSFYQVQVRTEGALIGYFESTGNAEMMKQVYKQRNNLYIVE